MLTIEHDLSRMHLQHQKSMVASEGKSILHRALLTAAYRHLEIVECRTYLDRKKGNGFCSDKDIW